MRRLPVERPNGEVVFVEVPDGEPAPYPTRNESDEPVDYRLASIYHCDRWATAASRCLDLDNENDRLRSLLAGGVKLLRHVYGSKAEFAHAAEEWLTEVEPELSRAEGTGGDRDG